MHTYTNTHTYTYTHTHTHTHTHIYTYTHTYSYMHTYKHSYIRMHMNEWMFNDTPAQRSYRLLGVTQKVFIVKVKYINHIHALKFHKVIKHSLKKNYNKIITVIKVKLTLFKNNRMSVGWNLPLWSKMIAFHQNVANCRNTLAVLTLRVKIFPPDVWMGQMCMTNPARRKTFLHRL